MGREKRTRRTSGGAACRRTQGGRPLGEARGGSRLEDTQRSRIAASRLTTREYAHRSTEGTFAGRWPTGVASCAATLEGLELTTAFLPGGDRGRGPFTRRESSPSRDVSTRTDGSSRVSPAAPISRVAVCGARSPQNLDAISSSESGSQGRRRASYSVRPRFRRRPTFSGATTSPISRQSRQRAMRVVLGLAGAFGGAVAAVTGTAVGYGYMLGSAPRSPCPHCDGEKRRGDARGTVSANSGSCVDEALPKTRLRWSRGLVRR